MSRRDRRGRVGQPRCDVMRINEVSGTGTSRADSLNHHATTGCSRRFIHGCAVFDQIDIEPIAKPACRTGIVRCSAPTDATRIHCAERNFYLIRCNPAKLHPPRKSFRDRRMLLCYKEEEEQSMNL
jgi:hypothetical protein